MTWPLGGCPTLGRDVGLEGGGSPENAAELLIKKAASRAILLLTSDCLCTATRGKMAGGAWDGIAETSELGAECCKAKKGVRRRRGVPRGKQNPDH